MRLVVSLPLSLLVLGCGEAPRAWVGRASGSDVAVAWVEQAGAARVYVCGGATTFGTHSRWFDAATEGGHRFDAERDGWRIEAAPVSASASRGSLVGPDGVELGFEATLAGSALEGPYESEAGGCTGAIVLPGDDGELALQGAWCDQEGHAAQVTPVLPIELAPLGLRVQVDLGFLGRGTLALDLGPAPVR